MDFGGGRFPPSSPMATPLVKCQFNYHYDTLSFDHNSDEKLRFDQNEHFSEMGNMQIIVKLLQI